MRLRTNIIAVESLTPHLLARLLRDRSQIQISAWYGGRGEREIVTVKAPNPRITIQASRASHYFDSFQDVIDYLSYQG